MNNAFVALDNLSFTVKSGEVVGIIGKNGAGKSTLLKILSKITAPSSGSIKIKGRVASLLEEGTGFNGELTGRENIYLNGAILGMTKREIAQKFDQIVSFSELEKFIDTPVKRYSSGMTVRLAFAVAAHLEAEVLIVDEVLAVGDLNFRKKCLGKMREISSSEGRTVLFVSHDMASIQNICSLGMVLDKGKIIFSGTANEAVKRYLKINATVESQKKEWICSGKSLPFAETLTINRFYVKDIDSQCVTSGVIFNSKHYSIEIEAELHQSDSRLIFMVAFYSEEQDFLFVTDIHDAGKHDFGKIDHGFLNLSVELPTHLLANGSYDVELLCALHHTGWILPPNNDSRISFVHFKDCDKNPYASENRLGLLAPILNWNISRRH
jgi:lipopolysaccharide transport system ATP-binding protein